ncbi:hypothetical protein LIER_20968 [Lithospermum erythrorhizon]|uniref:Uncharacterized protein n=1 Tax=Lithospermum erythrorhizon TaxID=34254 RepID=A0AAV3QQX1_LITER
MKKYGCPSSWTQMITLHEHYYDRRRMPCSPYLPISYAKDAGLIMFTAGNSAFVHFNGAHDWKYLKIRGVKSVYEAYSYVPTLLSLEDALTDEDEILNVNS